MTCSPLAIFVPLSNVEVHNKIYSKGKFVDKIYWKRGLLIKNDNQFVEITSDMGENSIRVYISGYDKASLLHKVRDIINKVNNEVYAEIRCKEMIQCKCETCKKSNEPFFFDYCSIEGRLSKGFDYHICGETYNNVGLDSILLGFVDKNTLSNYSVNIQQYIGKMGDKININNSSVGSVGKSSKSFNNKLEVSNHFEDKNHLKLLQELFRLKNEMINRASTESEMASIIQIDEAIEVAKSKDEKKVMQNLKSAGKFALNTAKDVGTDILAELIKKSMLGE